jgi:hypothetical protein
MQSVIRVVTTVIGLASTLAVAQERQSVGTVMPLLRNQFEQQCATGRAQLLTAKEGIEQERASSMVKMACDCMPKQLDTAEEEWKGGEAKGMITQEMFLARMKTSVSLCAAGVMRVELVARCQAQGKETLGIKDKAAYCGCVEEKMRELDDETLVNAAVTAQQSFDSRVRAREQGIVAPAPTASPIDKLLGACKQAQN